MTKHYFDHEKLLVYQKAIEFVRWADNLIRKISVKASVKNHLDETSTSIPLNIAEGNGKYTSKDRCKYFDISRGSALECASCLDVMVAKDLVDASEIIDGKILLKEIVSMLVGLIKSNSDRLHESSVEYYSKNS